MQSISLSTSWNSNRHRDGNEMLQEIRALDFEYAELGHGIRYHLWPGVLKALKEKVIKVSSVHNFCPVPIGVMKPSPNCFVFTDRKSSGRAAATRATLETIQHAVEVEAPVVVLHLGWVGPSSLWRKLVREYQQNRYLSRSYVATKLKAVQWRKENFPAIWKRVFECLEPAIDLAKKNGIKLGFEIRENFEEFPHEEEMTQILNLLSTETVGYWHDFGHAARKDFLGFHDHEETLLRRRNRLLGCHIHDCRPPIRDHLPIGEGAIPFSQLISYLPDQIIPVLELSPSCKTEQVIQSRNRWNSLVEMRTSSFAF